MDVLIKQVRIIQPESPHHDELTDIYISEGRIKEIGSGLEKNCKTIEGEDLLVSPGWVDMLANFTDPGEEYKEDINSGLKAAAQGGFTEVCLSPKTIPIVQNKTGIEYIKSASKNHLVKAHVCGALSENLEGENMAELYELHNAGARAFYQAGPGPENAGVLLRAMQYSNMFDGLIYVLPEDEGIKGEGQMHEGVESTKLGMKGIPAFAEKIRIQRDLELREYSDARLHIVNLSSKESLELVKQAKKDIGEQLSVSIAAHQLFFTDEDLAQFDANLKVEPPFRSSTDRDALRQAVADGTIDSICSDHQPQDIESKFIEFRLADYGMASIEFAFAMLNSSTELSAEQIVKLLSTNPRRLLKLEQPIIQKNAEANLTIFNRNAIWKGEQLNSASKAYNKPFANRTFKGKVIAVVSDDDVIEVSWK